MSIAVYIDGVIVPGDDTLKVQRGTISILQQSGVSTCEMVLLSLDASYRPQVGKLVSVYEEVVDEDPTIVFSGRIISCNEDTYPQLTYRAHRISCADHVWTCGKRIAGERDFSDQQRNDIIRELNPTGEGFGDTYIPAGEGGLIKEFRTVFGTVRDVYDQLAKLTDSVWWIDYERQIRFEPSLPASARFTVDDSYSDILHVRAGRGALQFEEAIDETANDLIIRFGKTEVPEDTESFGGAHPTQPTDGSRQNWTLEHEVASAPTITVDGLSKTVGIEGVDTGKDWYWNEGSKQISQDSGATELTSGQTLAITYVGLTYSALYRQDSGHIAAYGVLSKLIDITAATSAADAETEADQAIVATAQSTYTLRFPTLSRGEGAPKVGDRIDLSRTHYPAVSNLIVQSVRLQPFGDVPEGFYRFVEAKRGPKLKNGQALLASGTVSGSSVAGSSVGGGGGSEPTLDTWHSLTFASTVDVARGNGSKQLLILTGPVTLTASGWQDGDELLLLLVQQPTGGHVPTFSTGFKVPVGMEINGSSAGLTFIRFAYTPVVGMTVMCPPQSYDS